MRFAVQVFADWREFVSQLVCDSSRFNRLSWRTVCVTGARWPVLKIQYAGNGDAVLAISGRLQASDLGELAAALDSEPVGLALVLDLKDVVLADEDAIRFLYSCERDGIELRNCPSYIRTWMAREHA
jgi:hypothetical protein